MERVLRAQVYAIAASRSPRRPRRGAQRRARRRRDREAPWHAPQRGRSRAAAARLAGTGASAVGADTPIPPICVSTATPSPATGAGAGPAHGLPNSVPGFLRPCNCNEKSVMTAYTAPTFPLYSAIAVSAPSPRHRRRSPPTAVHHRARRRRRYVDDPARIGTGLPPYLYARGAPRAGLSEPARSVYEEVPMPVLAVAVPGVLPGFSGSSQVQTSLYLQVCECRHSN